MNIVNVKWVDTCYFHSKDKDHTIDDSKKPVFNTVGIFFGLEKTPYGNFLKISYMIPDDESIPEYAFVYIPVGCVISIHKIGEYNDKIYSMDEKSR